MCMPCACLAACTLFWGATSASAHSYSVKLSGGRVRLPREVYRAPIRPCSPRLEATRYYAVRHFRARATAAPVAGSHGVHVAGLRLTAPGAQPAHYLLHAAPLAHHVVPRPERLRRRLSAGAPAAGLWRAASPGLVASSAPARRCGPAGEPAAAPSAAPFLAQPSSTYAHMELSNNLDTCTSTLSSHQP